MKSHAYTTFFLVFMILSACRENTTPIFPARPTRPTNVPTDAHLFARDSFENPTWEWIHALEMDTCERHIFSISSYSGDGKEKHIHHRFASGFFRGDHTNHVAGSDFCFVEPFNLYAIHRADSFCLLFPIFGNKELFEIMGQDSLYEIPGIDTYKVENSHWKVHLHVRTFMYTALVPIRGDTFWLKRIKMDEHVVDSAMFRYTCDGTPCACKPEVLYADHRNDHFIPLCPDCALEPIGQWSSH